MKHIGFLFYEAPVARCWHKGPFKENKAMKDLTELLLFDNKCLTCYVPIDSLCPFHDWSTLQYSGEETAVPREFCRLRGVREVWGTWLQTEEESRHLS